MASALQRAYENLRTGEAVFRDANRFRQIATVLIRHGFGAVLQELSLRDEWLVKKLLELRSAPVEHLPLEKRVLLAVQELDFAAARRALDRALAIAPTYVEALEYLGMLLFEAGRIDAAFERLALVVELDPTRPYPLVHIARAHALNGNFDEALAMYARAEQLQAHAGFAAALGRLRLAAWRRDPASLALPDKVMAELETPRWKLVRVYLGALRGQLAEADALPLTASLITARQSPRALSSVAQLVAEIWLLLGRTDRAFAELDRGCKAGLLDILWLDRCALLEPLRAMPGFAEVRRQTLLRAEAMGG